ncbi:MAG: GNAT family N-acetyltransferase [Armatimonadota bacterium]
MREGRLETGPCRLRELPALRELLNAVFITERGAQGDLFEFAPLLYSEENVENLRVVRRGRELVGHAGILQRPIRWRGQVLRAGFIGGVCARRDLRGMGIGTLAMQDAAERMLELGVDFGVLWSGSPGFYERLGWRHAGGISIMRIAEAAEAGEVRHEIIPLAESPFTPEDCHELHEAAGRNEVMRSAEETRVKLTTGGREVLLALEGGRLDGYAVHGTTDVREIEGDVAACVSLLTHMARGGQRICVFPLHDPRIAPIQRALPVDVQRRPLGMVLVVDRAGLVAKIEAETGLSCAELGVPADLDAEGFRARVFGGPERPPSDDPLPLDIHIGYLDHV